jgi:hypothetical protein
MKRSKMITDNIISKNKISKIGKIIYGFATASIVLLCLTNTNANAQSPGQDTFSVNHQNNKNSNSATSNKPSTMPWEANKENTAIAIWFSKYDQFRDQYRPSEKDKVILTRPLMQEAERVQQWTNTASTVAKKYFLAAKSIRALNVPSGMTDVKEYRDLMADWYEDAASVYQDLIRPRPPAKTIEDLHEQLDAIKKRSEGLANNIGNLKNMDRELRQHYHVQPALQDDAVQQFARSK